jgi:hypothetical protein
MSKPNFRISALARLAAVAALSGLAGTSVANEESVTFVESVKCTLMVCEAQKKTVPVVEIVRAPDYGDFCVEFTRKLTGFQNYASSDPSIRISVPQYQDSPKRYYRCARGDKVASVGPRAD